MKNKILIRVDEKLLHAQIMLMWVKNSDIRKIIVVDDKLASNPFLIKVYELSVPLYITIEILYAKEFFSKYGTEKLYKESQNSLVILGSIEILRNVIQLGMIFKEVQIGFTRYEHLSKEKAFNMIGKDINKHIRKEGSEIKIYYQNAPEDSKIYFE